MREEKVSESSQSTLESEPVLEVRHFPSGQQEALTGGGVYFQILSGVENWP